jgi:hypothetical protein
VIDGVERGWLAFEFIALKRNKNSSTTAQSLVLNVVLSRPRARKNAQERGTGLLLQSTVLDD